MTMRRSNAFKIFSVTTFVLVSCFVGVLVYVHKVLADEADIDWTYLKAEVTSVTKSGNDYTANSTHRVGYDNDHTHTVSNRRIWGAVVFYKDAGGGFWDNYAQSVYTTYFDVPANTTSSYTTTRSVTEYLSSGTYKVEAKSNLESADWKSSGKDVYVQTAEFDRGELPSTPVSDTVYP